MVSLNQLVIVCLTYVAGLFIVAFAAERAALRGHGDWLRRRIYAWVGSSKSSRRKKEVPRHFDVTSSL